MWKASLLQFARFSVVGILNTLIDVITLNILLWRFPTHNANMLLIYNSLAYFLGTLNSFCLNKYWTFKQRNGTTSGEIVRFVVLSVAGILCSDIFLWLAAKSLHPLITNNLLWANISKAIAIAGTMTISYLGMRLWVFTERTDQKRKKQYASLLDIVEEPVSQSPYMNDGGPKTIEQVELETNKGKKIPSSLSIILPAYNEEIVIAETVRSVVDTLMRWGLDFEVIVVNDGSKDRTQAIIEEITAIDSRVILLNHAINEGYGATLISGFMATTKDLAFFMDSDGQFDIHDLESFFPLLEAYDAVLGYRVDRHDTWIRKVNAWGWKLLIGMVFDVHMRDVDCAFKLYPADFLHKHNLETRGAMINTEILYKFIRAGYTYTQIGVRHLPRSGGRATGAKPSVILRAFRELVVYAFKWHREEKLLGKNCLGK
jgi:putative flippase GtrA